MPGSRTKIMFVCQQCGHESTRWVGRCPGCGEWNSLVEFAERATPSNRPANGNANLPQPLMKVSNGDFARLVTGMDELDRVLGGGIVPGSVVLVGGDPGIGKSTLLLQVSSIIAEKYGPVLYISGEESVRQIRMRADRLGVTTDRLLALAESDLGQVLQHIDGTGPALVVVDSIQTMYSPDIPSTSGSVSQVRECAVALLQAAKSSGVPVFLVGHVTKEGSVAGPRVLEHIVDAVLYLEGERFHSYRLLRGAKNRFGSTNEVGVFEMRSEGMVEVPNPSEVFLAERQPDASGSIVAVTMEGTRPLLVEVQALVSSSALSLPRRSANGLDVPRLLLLTAVLSKRAGMPLSNQDIYINVVGGLKVNEPAGDLGVALAIASSLRDQALPADMVAIGEVGLSGELRRVPHLDRRLAEAEKLGFRRALVPGARHLPSRVGSLEVVPAGRLVEAISLAAGGPLPSS